MHYRTSFAVCAISTVAVVTFLSVGARAAEVDGQWEFAGVHLDETNYARVTLNVTNNEVTGRLNELTLAGTISGDELSFSAKRPNRERFGDFKGRAVGERLEGTAVWSGERKITWSATRVATGPAAPQVYGFEPTNFHRVFSDSIPPVLHIFPGDTVKTWTVDAGGKDSKGVVRSPGGNPQTGPFFVEGALP
ncbi:MAG TPA: hypothetical protein VLT36_04515, partial [Candidatus Dormibacteraeota bacterium]|nr:hypothetical protein [Candidatus Dormibacteraeota bacterium]